MSEAVKKVMIIIPSLSGGGAQRVMAILMKYIDRSRFKLHLVLVTDREGVFGDIPQDIDIHRLYCRHVRASFPKLLKTVWKIKPHVILTTLAYLNIYVLMTKPFLPRRTRIVIREANTPSLSLRHGRLSSLLKRLSRLCYPFADAVVCQTADIALEMERDFGVKRSKIHVIVNPVDASRIREAAEGSRNPFLNQAKFQIVAAGRLTRQKGFDILLLALFKLIKKFESVHLTILGDGEEKPLLAEMIAELGLGSKVTLAGFVSDVEAYLRHADLFVLSSRWEGMPNVVLEALACGTPVVAMEQAGGIRDIIKDGVNGRLVSPFDGDRLAYAIGQALSELDSLKKGAVLEPRFFAENVVRRYENALTF